MVEKALVDLLQVIEKHAARHVQQVLVGKEIRTRPEMGCLLQHWSKLSTAARGNVLVHVLELSSEYHQHLHLFNVAVELWIDFANVEDGFVTHRL